MGKIGSLVYRPVGTDIKSVGGIMSDFDQVIAEVDGKLNSENLEDGGVETSDLADAAVTSRKAKLTAGIITPSTSLTLTSSYKDVAGAVLEITPDVASNLLVVAIFDFHIILGPITCLGTLKVDAIAEESRHAESTVGSGVGGDRRTVSQVYLIPLSAAAHTIQMRAKGIIEAPGSGYVSSEYTQFLHVLTAS